jgi:hypothetical protein
MNQWSPRYADGMTPPRPRDVEERTEETDADTTAPTTEAAA